MLVKGDIDLMLEQLPFADDIAYYTLGEDHLYLLVTDEYLKMVSGRLQSRQEHPDQHRKDQVLEPCNFLLNKTGNTIRSAMTSIFQSEKWLSRLVWNPTIWKPYIICVSTTMDARFIPAISCLTGS